MLNAKLVVVGGDAKAKEINLKLPTVIGRSREATLTLPHPLVSRRHTELFEQDGALFVRDLGSLNGTYVNNRRISNDQMLAPNQLLTLGNVTFRAVYKPTVPTTVKPPEDDHLSAQPPQPRSRPANHPLSATVSQPKEETVSFHPVNAEMANCNEAANGNEAVRPARPEVDRAIVAGASDILNDVIIQDDQLASPERSISMSAIDSLPGNDSRAVDALTLESIQIDGEHVQGNPATASSIDLEIEGQSAPPEVTDSAIGSFLKKLPR